MSKHFALPFVFFDACCRLFPRAWRGRQAEERDLAGELFERVARVTMDGQIADYMRTSGEASAEAPGVTPGEPSERPEATGHFFPLVNSLLSSQSTGHALP